MTAMSDNNPVENTARPPCRHTVIYPDDAIAVSIGFLSGDYDGYLCMVDHEIYISFIVSRTLRRGNLKKLFNNIIKLGYDIKVPTPLGLMEYILNHYGFTPGIEYDDITKQNYVVYFYDCKRGIIL